jgi:hypothetical protein
MSAPRQNQTFLDIGAMSALPPKADMAGRQQIVEEVEEEVRRSSGWAQVNGQQSQRRSSHDDVERGAARIGVLFGQRS